MQSLVHEANREQVATKLMEIKEVQSQLERKDWKLAALYEKRCKTTA